MVTDLLRWADQCEALSQGQAQEAELAPLEPELKVSIRPVDRLGHFKIRVHITPDHLTQQHSFEFEIDQTYLLAIETQCRTIAGAYPVRGEETKRGV